MAASTATAASPATAVPKAMVEQRLHLFQLVSPALPVGGFSYSEGLESLVQQGRLGDAATLRSWLEAELWRGCLTVEAATLPGLMALLERARSADSVEAEAALRAVVERDGWLLAQREAPEVRAQQRQMGGSLSGLLADLGWPLPAGAPPLAWPAAWAWAGVCLQLEAGELVEAFLYSWVAGQLSAAVAILATGKFLPHSLHWAPGLLPADEQFAGLSEFRQAVRAWSFPRWILSFLAIFTLGVVGTILWKLFYLSWNQLYLAGWAGSPPADELQDIVQVVMRTEFWSLKFVIITLAVAIGAPIMEELVFRGMLYPSLKRLCQPFSPGWSRLLAAILTGMVFSTAHTCASAAIPLFAFGAFMCLIRDRFGLLTCISIHASFNLWNLVWLKLAPNASNL